MVSLIKSAVRLSSLIAMYIIAIGYISDWIPEILKFLSINGVPASILTIILCAISTLNWIFTPEIINIALIIWLLLPPVKLTLYFMHKVATI